MVVRAIYDETSEKMIPVQHVWRRGTHNRETMHTAPRREYFLRYLRLLMFKPWDPCAVVPEGGRADRDQ
jgi:hypothetical protein